MKENEIKGHLSQTPEYHKRIGSSGSGFENLIEGKLRPDISFGEQMTREALKKYYDFQLDGVCQGLRLPPEGRTIVMSVAQGFEADLSYLESRGIDITDAKLAFEKFRKLG